MTKGSRYLLAARLLFRRREIKEDDITDERFTPRVPLQCVYTHLRRVMMPSGEDDCFRWGHHVLGGWVDWPDGCHGLTWKQTVTYARRRR